MISEYLTGNEAAMVQFGVLPRNLPEVTEETQDMFSVRIDCFGAEICILNLTNTKQGVLATWPRRSVLRCRFKDNIKMNLRGCGGVDLISLTQVTGQWPGFVNTLMKLRIP
jgi:hypothetical protein